MRPVFRKRRVSPVVLILCLGQIGWAQTAEHKITVHLDPERTEVQWTLHDVLHTIHGTFRLKNGMMTFDPSTGAADGEFLVDTATGESGNGIRDKKMQKEVLESSRYPQAFFHPVKVLGSLTAGSIENMTVSGTFQIHGANHPLTLQIAVRMNGTDATATTQFIVPYVEWGMKDESTFLLKVDKEVIVDVTGRGRVEGLPEGR